MRRGTAGFVAVVLAMSAVAASSAAVLASNGAATPFKVAFDDGSTHYDCAGARVENRVSIKDSETCLVTGDTSLMIAGTYSGDPYGDLPWFPHARWQSDTGDGRIADHWTVTVNDNGDGTFTLYAVAYF
jgi:hypothetical protein